MAETWPVSVPYKPAADSMKGNGFRRPLMTDFEDGNQRRRRSSTKNIARIEMRIDMSYAQFLTFKVWVRDTLVDGTLAFTMPVFNGSAYQGRTCSFAEQYQFAPAGWDRHAVSFSLDVEDY